MATDNSYRLSGNGYDTATEDSISMYYSFNASDNDKTIENLELDSTVEVTIESSFKTVVKAPLTTPITGKFAKRLHLNSDSSSTPSDSKMLPVIESNVKDNADVNLKSNVKAIVQPKYNNDQLIDNQMGQRKIPEIIVERFQEMRVETTTVNDSSIEIVEEVNQIAPEIVLKDTATKIWPIDNKMENVGKEKGDILEFLEKPDIFDKQMPAKSLDSQHSLAEKMVQEIRSLLQGTEISKVTNKGKENIEEDSREMSASDPKNMPKSAGKKIPILKKQSRLSTIIPRKSLLQTDIPAKSITPATRIVPKSRKSISSLSSGIPTRSDVSSSSSYGSIKSSSGAIIQAASSTQSFARTKRMSMFSVTKSSLGSIAESDKKDVEKYSFKRFSGVNTKPRSDTVRSAHKIRSVAKTTLNSPVMVRRDLLRRSNNKLTSVASGENYMISVDKVDSTSKNLPVLAKSAGSSDRMKPQTSKTHISREDFVCEKCSRTFRVSSIFEAHKKTHNPAVGKEANTCKFCDKTFAITKALDKHLLENCAKIPMSERKKIKIAASEHAPVFGDDSAANRSKKRSQRQSILPQSDRISSRKSVVGSCLMPPPSSTKVVKAPMAHSGISKTPNKSVSCKPCEKTFDNVLSFAEHVLSHSNSSLGEE